MDDAPTLRMNAIRRPEPRARGPFPHPPPPFVTDPAECTRVWKRPVYEPTVVLPIPADEPENPPRSPAVRADPPSRPTAPPAEPSRELPVVRLAATEAPAAAPSPPPSDELDGTRGWSWAAAVLLSALAGAATWLGLAHLGVT